MHNEYSTLNASPYQWITGDHCTQIYESRYQNKLTFHCNKFCTQSLSWLGEYWVGEANTFSLPDQQACKRDWPLRTVDHNHLFWPNPDNWCSNGSDFWLGGSAVASWERHIADGNDTCSKFEVVNIVILRMIWVSFVLLLTRELNPLPVIG